MSFSWPGEGGSRPESSLHAVNCADLESESSGWQDLGVLAEPTRTFAGAGGGSSKWLFPLSRRCHYLSPGDPGSSAGGNELTNTHAAICPPAFGFSRLRGDVRGLYPPVFGSPYILIENLSCRLIYQLIKPVPPCFSLCFRVPLKRRLINGFGGNYSLIHIRKPR